MFAWWLIQQAKVQDKQCYVCILDNKEALAEKLMYIVVVVKSQAILLCSTVSSFKVYCHMYKYSVRGTMKLLLEFFLKLHNKH